MSVLPESFKHEMDPNFPFSSELLYNWSKMHKKAISLYSSELFKKSKLSVPGKNSLKTY